MSDRAPPGKGPWAQRLRLWSGLILFAFASTHFLNHALGIHSLGWMEAFQEVREFVWDSPPGLIALYGAALVHFGLGLWKIAARRTWKMPIWEGVQIALAVIIPWQLIIHVIGTRAAEENFAFDDSYANVLPVIWSGAAWEQTLLMLVVWIHAAIGLHYWLRLYPLYRRALPVALAFAILVPALATWGWTLAAERLVVAGQRGDGFAEGFIAWALPRIEVGRWIAYGLIALAVLVPLVRWLMSLRTTTVAITYPGGQVLKATQGATLLETSRTHGYPHASVCGGRARCSTCRTLIIEGAESLPGPDPAETRVLARVGADSRVRLACQIRLSAPLSVQPLVPSGGGTDLAEFSRDAYHWGVEKPAVIMFADLRNFTGLSEERLPYDTVFLLNRYLGLMREAIEGAGGQVDKFIGDGIMAIFGISDDITVAARQSLDASAAMAEALDQLNDEFSGSMDQPLRMGIGVHLGPVILGRIGAAGKGQSDAITALGDTVNAASRLESASKTFGVVLVASRPVLKAAAISLPDAAFEAIAVKGKKRTLDVVPIADPRALVSTEPVRAVAKKSSDATETLPD